MLILAYLSVLFAFAAPHDTFQVSHTLIRLLLGLLEACVFWAISRQCLDRWQRGGHWLWWLACLIVLAAFMLIYLAQLTALFLSGNFISQLALMNIRDALLTINWQTVAGGLVLAIAMAAFGLFLWVRRPQNRPPVVAHKWLWAKRILKAAILACYLILIARQHPNNALEPGYTQTPIASLIATSWHAAKGYSHAQSGTGQVDVTCLTSPGSGLLAGYPFQKDAVYAHTLPFPSTSTTTKKPNVFVFFSEGLSARVIGAYGGKHTGLTPNMDTLASHSMQVFHYFNHTAATYRGLTGQLSSGFTYANGNAWEKDNNGKLLSTTHRQTLARILGHHGYESVFFQPKHPGHFSDMMMTLGFRKVFTWDTIAPLVDGHIRQQNHTRQLDDDSLFRGLIAYLQKRAASTQVKQPLFLATYNIGTHAFIPMVKGGVAYGDGNNRVLNKFHNYDAALGKLLDYIRHSTYANNTILIFTSDHATYPSATYKQAAGPGIRPFFVDAIPLLIHDPTHKLPSIFNADGRNSLDLAPTVLQLLGIRRAPNSFLGRSLFEPRSLPLGIAAVGNKFYISTADTVYPVNKAPRHLVPTARCEASLVKTYYDLESKNRLFKPADVSPSRKTTPQAKLRP